jgi:death-on-curing protein
MVDHLAVAEAYQMQHLLIDRFGGRHGVRDKNAVEAAVFRPQIGYYNSLEEEAAALMESLGNNHGFLDGKKRIAFTAADVFLRRNGFCIEVDARAGYEFIYGLMVRGEFRFPKILDWIRQQIKSTSLNLLQVEHPVFVQEGVGHPMTESRFLDSA